MENTGSTPQKPTHESRTDRSTQTPIESALTSLATLANSKSSFFSSSRHFPQSCASDAQRFDFCRDRDLPPPPPPCC